jgi:hypothetical protein
MLCTRQIDKSTNGTGPVLLTPSEQMTPYIVRFQTRKRDIHIWNLRSKAEAKCAHRKHYHAVQANKHEARQHEARSTDTLTLRWKNASRQARQSRKISSLFMNCGYTCIN